MRLASQSPAVRVPGAGPRFPAGAGHDHLENGARRGGRVAQGLRQGPHEGVEDGAEVFLAVPGLAGGVADLLVVGPVLGEVPGGIQPGRGRLRSCPANAVAEGVRVGGRPEVRDLVRGDGELFDEQPRAEAAGGGHPFGVDAVQEGGERLAVAGVQGRVAVAVPGQPPDMVAEHVGGDVLDVPARADRGLCPLPGPEPAQQGDERGLLPGEQRPDVDGRSQPGGVGHRPIRISRRKRSR